MKPIRLVWALLMFITGVTLLFSEYGINRKTFPNFVPAVQAGSTQDVQATPVPRTAEPGVTLKSGSPVKLRPKVTLVMPTAPVYIGSYVRLPVMIAPHSGITLKDLRFRVVEGPAGGTVSYSLDKTFNLKRPEIMFLAGYKPGKYTLEVSRAANSAPLFRGRFELTVKSPIGPLGPSLVVQGMHSIPESASAWGGGPSGLQNMGTQTATGTRRVALLLVDTNEQRFTSDAPTLDSYRKKWRDNIIDGLTINNVARSLRRFYNEGSYQKLDFTMQVFGPYNMDGNWDEVGPGAGWVDHAQAAITAADGDVDYNQFDTVLVVSQSVGALNDPAAKYAWPTASIGGWNGWITDDGSPTLGTIQMPNDWTERDGRQIYATASHEMGHNLGIGDLYSPPVAGRNVGGWDIMDTETQLPNYSLADKMKLGWIDGNWVKSFNFATLGNPVDENVTLQPAADGAPAAGRYLGAEVRVTDGLNYYFEYRRAKSGQVSDLALPTDNRVLGTDVASSPYQTPIQRPDILLLPNDSDGDGPVLDNNKDYRETDYTSPIYPIEFRADVNNINGSTADLRVRYGVNDKPDPSIRPWGAPPWQSPDIEVRNARNAADPAWFNVPWEQNPNTVVAKVKNNGLLNANAVRVNFFVVNANVGGMPETFLGSDVADIPAGQTVEFTTQWVPPSAGHYCVVVRIPLYISATTPPVAEMTELNNLAQSNYDRFISAQASPAERKIMNVMVGNPFDYPTRVFISVKQTNPYYRTYVAHKWMDLQPRENQQLEVMFEYTGQLPLALRDKHISDELVKNPNRISITTAILDPKDKRKHRMFILGGQGISVVTGRATKFQSFRVGDGVASGTVTTTDGQPVSGGKIIFSVYDTLEPKLRASGISNHVAAITNGNFHLQLGKARGKFVQAYFLPPSGYGDATSTTLEIR